MFPLCVRHVTALCPPAGGGWTCEQCGRTFRTQSKLSHHRAWHRGDTICQICVKVFSRTDHLRRHMRLVHGALLPLRTRPSAAAGSGEEAARGRQTAREEPRRGGEGLGDDDLGLTM